MAKRRGFHALIGLVALLTAAVASGHGGVSMEDDNCIMKIGMMRAHFTGYQPEKRASQEFCEDIPELGRAIIVVDYASAALRQQEVEFRVLKDVKNLKSRGRYEDLGSEADIAAATLVHVPSRVYPRGTLTFDQSFDAPGWYIGMITAKDPASGTVLHSVFPFKVGVHSLWRYLPAFMIVFALAGLTYRLTGRKKAAAKVN